jgi:hypothetical protein
MKKNKVSLVIGAIALVGAGGYLVYKNLKSKVTKSPLEEKTEAVLDKIVETTAPITSAVKNMSVAVFPLKKGSVGSNVAVLQKWLNDNNYSVPDLIEDGIFGTKTQQAVINMQKNPNEKAINDYGNSFGFGFVSGEIKKDFYKDASRLIGNVIQRKQDIAKFGFNVSELEKSPDSIFTKKDLNQIYDICTG